MHNSIDRQGRGMPTHARLEALTERARSLLGEAAGDIAAGDDREKKRALASRLLGREDARISTLEQKITRLAARQEAARRLDRMVDQQLKQQEQLLLLQSSFLKNVKS